MYLYIGILHCFLIILFNKTMQLLGFDTLFEQIMIAWLIVSLYINIVILKFIFNIGLFLLLKSIRLLNC